MPMYAYKGVANSGKSVAGVRDAESPKTLRQLLRKDGVLVTSFELSKGGKAAKDQNAKKGGLSKEVDLGGLLGGVSKVEIARDVVGGLLDDAPLERRLGLMAYGHHRRGDCNDIELVQPVGAERSSIRDTVNALNAIAGFEKSGHYFFNAPIGRGYDDGLVSAIAILDMLDRNPEKSMADLRRALPTTWGSPTMSPHCDDEKKYGVVENVVRAFQAMRETGETVAGHGIRDLVTVNGVRVVADDGTWGLVRASSNKPELVVVVESPVSEARMRAMFESIGGILRENSEVGAYNQAI